MTTPTNKRTSLTTLLVMVGVISPGVARAASATAREGSRPIEETVLRIAHSADGLEFRDTGEIFRYAAAAPDLTMLPDGRLLALFDRAAEDDDADSTTIAATISRDNGRTWSAPRDIELRARDRRSLPGWNGDFVLLGRNQCRLFFATDGGRPAQNTTQATDAPARLSVAATRDGTRYLADDRGLLRPSDTSVEDVMAVTVGRSLHLVVLSAAADDDDEDRTHTILRHLTSRDGWRFVEASPLRLDAECGSGCLVPVKDGLRLYITVADGIASFVSAAGQRWERESGLRLPDGMDPAVAQLRDRSWLMIYAAQRPHGRDDDNDADDADADEQARTELVSDDGAETPLALLADEAEADGMRPEDQADESGVTAPDLAGSPDTDHTASPGAAQVKTDGSGRDPVDRAAHDGLDDAEASTADLAWADSLGPADVQPDGSDFAPLPDFTTQIDYLEWWSTHLALAVPGNAAEAYAAFMPNQNPGRPDDPGPVPWPTFNNILNSPDGDRTPRPWDPLAQPTFEKSYQEAQDVLSMFADATALPNYSTRRLVNGPNDAGQPTPPVLMGLLLPALAPHRELTRATLAAAWRLEDGKVAPDRMIESWETCLHGADHMHSGSTLIEHLVGTAEDVQVRQSAMLALDYDVFEDEQSLEEALDTLRLEDRPVADLGNSIRGEHAMTMEVMQSMFRRAQPDGEVRLDMRRVGAILGNDGSIWNTLRLAGESNTESVTRWTRELDTYYRTLADRMRAGYPQVRTRDLNQAQEEISVRNPIAKAIVPALARVHALNARAESWRRATQLTYAVHLHQLRTGEWPATLHDLPEEYEAELRTDPFTGGDFGYRVDPDGPTIYSLSENGLDDGGVHSPRWSDEVPEGGSDDFVFWPPQPQPQR